MSHNAALTIRVPPPHTAGTGSFIWAIEWKAADVEKLQS
jgi:hypothetical protein